MNPNSEVLQIPIEDLVPNRFQPRISFDEKALNDLANSIRQHGIIQPLVVRRLKDKYEIVAGERRYKAAQIAGLISVPALVTDVSDESSAEIALVENVQRRDLSSIEEAKSYKNILDKSDMTQEELAKKMGLSQSSVANKLRLLHLSEDVQNALLEGKISERHARSLLAIGDEDTQNNLLKRIIDERLTVKQLDEEIKNINRPVRDDIVDDVPLVDINENLEQMQQDATDIIPQYGNNSYEQPSEQSMSDMEPTEEGKFFKVDIPEDESVDFSSQFDPEPTVQNINTIPSEPAFFDFGSKDIDDEPSSFVPESEPINESAMISEEILDQTSNNDNDIETLDIDPNITIFENEKSDQHLDLPGIISEIRNLVNKLNINNNLKISEIDTEKSYKIEIDIEKES